MSNQLDYAVCEGIAALADYNNPTRPSHARVTLLFYIALRSASEYFWGSVENTAKWTAMNPSTAGQLFRDLEDVGAIAPVPIAKIPDHIADRIKQQMKVKVIPPAKKVWRYTGVFCINGITYQMKRESEGGDLIPDSPNNSNLGSPNNWLTQDIIKEESKDKDKEKKKESKDLILVAQQVETTATLTDSQMVLGNGQIVTDTSVKAKRHASSTSNTTTPPSSATPPTPKAKTPLIVNQTNAALARSRPANITDEEHQTWLKQKPIWSLFAEWHIMNITDGEFNDWRQYKEHAAPMQWDEVVTQAQNMGKWLDAHAKKAKVELTYQWVIDWHQWYTATVMNDTITKYPTTKDGFKRNFALYVDYLYQQSKGNQ